MWTPHVHREHAPLLPGYLDYILQPHITAHSDERRSRKLLGGTVGTRSPSRGRDRTLDATGNSSSAAFRRSTSLRRGPASIREYRDGPQLRPTLSRRLRSERQDLRMLDHIWIEDRPLDDARLFIGLGIRFGAAGGSPHAREHLCGLSPTPPSGWLREDERPEND